MTLTVAETSFLSLQITIFLMALGVVGSYYNCLSVSCGICNLSDTEPLAEIHTFDSILWLGHATLSLYVRLMYTKSGKQSFSVMYK